MPYFKTENGNAENIKYDNTKSVKEAIDEIKASSSSNPTAASVTFDNANTGLNATNVQDAVTEVNGKLAKSVDANLISNPTCASTKNTMIAYVDITEDGLYLIVGGSQVVQSLSAVYYLTIGLANSSGELISSPYMLVRNISMNGGGGGSLSSIIGLKKGARVGMFLYNTYSSSVTAQYIRFTAVKL